MGRSINHIFQEDLRKMRTLWPTKSTYKCRIRTN